jgi:hypothetical protein
MPNESTKTRAERLRWLKAGADRLSRTYDRAHNSHHDATVHLLGAVFPEEGTDKTDPIVKRRREQARAEMKQYGDRLKGLNALADGVYAEACELLGTGDWRACRNLHSGVRDFSAILDAWESIAHHAEVALLEPEQEQEQDNTGIFSREGATWRVRWKGREGTVKDSLGVRYLARLVEFQGRKVSARDLRSYCSMKTADWAGKGCAEDLCCGDAGTRNGVRYDDGTVPDAAAQTEMWERYRAIKDSQDPAEIVEARDLLKHIRRFKPDAKAGDTNTVKAIDAKAADSIRNAIGRALKALAGEDSTDDSAMPELVKHLKRSTETGRVLCYKP